MGQQGLVFDGRMIRLEDGSEVALDALIEDARRRRGAGLNVRPLFHRQRRFVTHLVCPEQKG